MKQIELSTRADEMWSTLTPQDKAEALLLWTLWVAYLVGKSDDNTFPERIFKSDVEIM